MKRRRVDIQQMVLESSRKNQQLIRRRFALALKIQQEDFALIFQQSLATVDPVATQRFPDAVFVYSDASNSSIQSLGNPVAKNRRSSKAQRLKNESAAKQLTTYEELSKMDVNF
ncbi:putative aldo-keto reductase 3-like [Dorcoceras hygrometricum]|uniref:Putative aldo-keto reductase 3-like n=1 Tax=Dorcoceras hygrometricum TaxID=472368 RepID=A0A2Z7BJS7_9LAMI|nr:putative aldo-keto reductase 3-like [Dorcoceras hygrometricum]